MRAQKEIRRMDNTDTIIKFEELENRIEQMEAEADLVNFGSKANLADELERLAVDEEIEKELRSLKATSVDRMEARVDALETIIEDK
jgi:phage shock protein A